MEDITAWKEEIDTSVADLVVKVDAVDNHTSKSNVVDDLKQQVSLLSNKID
jgi:hypothetical protein